MKLARSPSAPSGWHTSHKTSLGMFSSIPPPRDVPPQSAIAGGPFLGRDRPKSRSSDFCLERKRFMFALASRWPFCCRFSSFFAATLSCREKTKRIEGLSVGDR